MKNLVNNHIGTISQMDSFKAIRKASREVAIESGVKTYSKPHKNRKKEANRNACRTFKY